MIRQCVTVITLILALASAAVAQTPASDGEAVYQRACASCHQSPAAESRAPTRDILATLAPEAILTSLTSGKMFRQGSELNDPDRRAVAAFLAGRPLGAAAPVATSGRCTAKPTAPTAADIASGWTGWSPDHSNARFVSQQRGGLTAAQVPQLKLKWALGFPGVTSARAQPAIAGGRLYVGSESGTVYAVDAKTGCTYWTYQAKHGVRTAISVGPYKGGMALYFADGGAFAYAIDSVTGREIWATKLDDHIYAVSTGAPTLHDGRVYVVTSGLGEEGQGGNAKYPCCTFRGSLSSLDAATGKVMWKTYTVPESKPNGPNAIGVQTYGPSGGGIWAAPTVDAQRRTVYVTTGNGYTGPQTRNTNALLAFDMATGAIKWSFWPGPDDVWVGGCRPENPPQNTNCPAKLGPDHDFSMPPALVKRSNGQDILIVISKSGMSYGVDPDKGTQIWEYRTSPGSGLGGQWGLAADDRNVYFGINGPNGKAQGGMRAARIDSGQEVWSKPASDRLCGTLPGCSAAQGAAVTAIPGMVFSVSMDGGVRAYAADDGTIVWSYDTNREFETVNGVKAKGGAMDGSGVVVEDGMVYVNSGYVSLIGRPGNVLLAFGVD
jgi:polyvinyl alcohol dehydrogenase (cytochrome)